MVDSSLITISTTHVVSRNEMVLTTGSLTDINRVGLTRERYAEYLKMFKELGLKGGITRDATKLDKIIFRAEKPSFFNGLSEKGYSYSAGDLGPCLDNLNSYVPPQSALNRPEGYIVFERVGPHWYLYKGW